MGSWRSSPYLTARSTSPISNICAAEKPDGEAMPSRIRLSWPPRIDRCGRFSVVARLGEVGLAVGDSARDLAMVRADPSREDFRALDAAVAEREVGRRIFAAVARVTVDPQVHPLTQSSSRSYQHPTAHGPAPQRTHSHLSDRR